MHLAWRRTIIGGESAPYQYSADFQSEYVGRIMKETTGKTAGIWQWFRGSASGSAATRDEAVFQVERAYTRVVVKADYPK